MPERPSLLDRGSSRRQNVKKEFQNVKKEPHQQHPQLERQYTTTQKIPLERPSFPDPGGTIGAGGRFFCLGFLGKGTFCSIHKNTITKVTTAVKKIRTATAATTIVKIDVGVVIE